MMPEPDAPAQAQARAHFERARQAAEAGECDRAIDAYLEGLRLAPDDVSGGHIELRVLALQRLGRGGAKPAAEEVQQRLSEGGSPLDRMLNAEYLLAKDPEHLAYGEAVLKAAVAGRYKEAARWIADLMFLANNNAKKPQIELYVLLKDAYRAIGQYNRAASACQRAILLAPRDKTLLKDLKRLRAKLSPAARPPAPRATPQATETEAESPAAQDEFADRKKAEAVVTGAADAQGLAEARSFFAQARAAAEKKQYDFAIDMYLDGLMRAPDALEEGHLPLCELGLQRRGQGGKKPSMMDRVRRMRGKTALEQMLNAEYLYVKDPDNMAYAEAMLKAAIDGGFRKTAHWVANLIFQMNNAVAKPSVHTYLVLKDSYKALGQYDKAVAACQRASRMRPEDKDLADECKNLSAELAMSKGKYDGDGDFRQSIRDREAQAKLYAQDRVIKTQDYRLSAVEEARKEYARAPELPKNLFNLTDALAGLETDEAENEAIQLLEQAYVGRHNFNFRERAGLLQIGQLKRRLREVRRQLETQPESVEAKSRMAELTAKLNDTELEHYRLCVENYPTDLSHKYEYAQRLLLQQRYNEAIPLFQEAQRDPRRKVAAMDRIGSCFFLKGWYADAIDVFTQAIAAHEIKDDGLAKELRYNLARAYEEQGQKEKALEIYRRIAQLDFGYKDVSARVDQLRAGSDPSGPGAPEKT
ncbi:MAG: tetratricopeptide repeat protein [Planctomycetes bacterium]|nr:tetratricopeptide repeat protein [Planctomycetota bacterium]